MLMPVKPIRPQTYTLKSYLDRFKEREVKGDADTQRAMGCYSDRMFNELVVSVLIGEYIPSIILGEMSVNTESYIEDGLQRTTALSMFRYGNKAITKDIADSVIGYQVKVKDENGNFVVDENDSFVKEWTSFDIKYKTFDQLPKELQKKFDEYQIELAIHTDSTKKEISRRIRIYNEHENMKAAQRAFTYMPTFAGNIRNILSQNRFYKDCIEYSDKEFTNGMYEKIICETDMIIFHLDEWQSVVKKMGMYIENNASDDEFEYINKITNRLYNLLQDDTYKDLFSKKNTYLWTALFNKFVSYNLEDEKFLDFLDAFNTSLCNKKIKKYGMSFNEYDKCKTTKDKKVVLTKLDILTQLMEEYLHINKEETHSEIKEVVKNTTETTEEVASETENNNVESFKDETDSNISEQNSGSSDVLQFVQENVSEDISELDINDYEQDLEDIVRISSPIYQKCKTALIAIMAYVYKAQKDVEFSEWMSKYQNEKIDFSPSQKVNYTYIKKDFDDYCAAMA